MGTTISVFSMEDIENFVVKPLTGKVHLSNEIISVLSNELWHISKSTLSLYEGPIYLLFMLSQLLIPILKLLYLASIMQ